MLELVEEHRQRAASASPPPAAGIPWSFPAFCKTAVTEKGHPYTTHDRPYLPAVLEELGITEGTTVQLKARQIGGSTGFVLSLLWFSLLYPRTTQIYMTDTLDHARKFSKGRFRPILHDMGHVPTKNDRKEQLVLEYTMPYTRSIIYMMSAHNGYTQAESISADRVILDEAQNTELEQLDVLTASLARSKYGALLVAGTPDMQGSAWEEFWRRTDMREWNDEIWEAQNPKSEITGFRIPQTLMPDMTDHKLARLKRQAASKAGFLSQVLAIFPAGLGIPLTVAEARFCYRQEEMTIPTRINRTKGPVYAFCDLAGGGDAYTVVTFVQHRHADRAKDKADMLVVLATFAYDDSRNQPMFDKMAAKFEDYAPDAIISDAGGNADLLGRMQDEYDVMTFKSQGIQLDRVKYPGNNHHTISKSFFMQRTIDRILDKRISIPGCRDTLPWTIEHLTAEMSETVNPKNGDAYQRFERMPNRQDDFLQSLMFGEAFLYTMHDDKNPYTWEPDFFTVKM